MILVTGWTGNTGGFVVRMLRERYPDQPIVGLARSPDAPSPPGVLVEPADLRDEGAVEEVFRRHAFTTILHVANIRFSPLIMRLAEAYRVPHTVLVHTTGIYSRYQEYSSLYREIEGGILDGRFEHTAWTILRPTMIYGNHRDHNLHKLIRVLHRYPVFPVFGGGSAVMQPVHVEDLAAAVVACVGNDRVKRRGYDLSGGSVVTYGDILRRITRLLGKRVRFVPVPLPAGIFFARLYGRASKHPIITVEQIQRLQEDKSYPHEAAARDLDFRPRPFEEGIAQEVAELRERGLI
uniref:NAD-dependent epimerase/dehydratase domain-containing protein n=1 Tax=uncultured Armatimonadetes bacterium TaxID=157466 RepID=A0A6J4JYD8_9BACT|nr:hypothetical protein AVDCRST_MAG63-4331 [uncultured Armatimonadetes bacterium]